MEIQVKQRQANADKTQRSTPSNSRIRSETSNGAKRQTGNGPYLVRSLGPFRCALLLLFVVGVVSPPHANLNGKGYRTVVRRMYVRNVRWLSTGYYSTTTVSADGLCRSEQNMLRVGRAKQRQKKRRWWDRGRQAASARSLVRAGQVARAFVLYCIVFLCYRRLASQHANTSVKERSNGIHKQSNDDSSRREREATLPGTGGTNC